jgi:zinc and cadmium transporter
MSELTLIILSTFALSLITFVSVILLSFKEKLLKSIIFSLVAIAAGTMLGSSFLHLLPESMEFLPPRIVLKATLMSMLGFYLLEKIMHWHHPHNEEGHVHTFGYLNLFGDIIHNFIDGLILASAFVVDIRLGFITLFALALHEIPQELSDFAVLIYAGFTKKKAIIVNFLAGVSSVLGGIVGYFLSHSVETFVPYLLPIAAGGFLYIATSDLVPEIKKERDFTRSMTATIMLMLGIALSFLIGVID